MPGVEVDPILYEATDGVANLTLNRPEAMNSLSMELVYSLHDKIKRVREDDNVRVVVIRGNDRAFSAGADLKFVNEALKSYSVFTAFVNRLNDAFFALEALPVPVIGVIKGFALAGGFEMLLACDMALAADDARIGDQHANFGLMAGAGGTARLIRKVGLQYAMEICLTGKWLSGKEAAEIGLVLRSVPGDSLEDEVAKLVGSLKEKSRTGLAFTKRAIVRGLEMPMRQGIDEEVFSLFEYFASSPDPANGIRAFIEKRKPDFSAVSHFNG